MKTGKLLLVVLLLAFWNARSAERFLFLQFQNLLMLDDKLIFSEPGLKPHRLICIRKESGQTAWQITNRTQTLRPICVLNNQAIVGLGPDLYRCTGGTGHLDLLYATGHKEDVSSDSEPGGTLWVAAGDEKAGHLVRLNGQSGQVVWKCDRHGGIVAKGNTVLLCRESDRSPVQGGGYEARDKRWVAISKDNGMVQWSCAPSAAGTAVGDYFLIFLKDTIDCRKQADGTLVKRYKLGGEPYPLVSLAAKGERLFVRVRRPEHGLESYAYLSLTVPTMERGALAESDWADATQAPIQDSAYRYIAALSQDGSTTGVVRIEIQTGKRQVLYEEPIAPEMRRSRIDARRDHAGKDLE